MDCELIERARRGDTASYGELVRRHQALAFRAAYLVTGDAAEAEDVIQDAFVRAFRGLDRFKPGAPFHPWLLRIVTNEALNRRRADQRRVRLERRVFESDAFGRVADSPEAEILAGERREQIEEALAGMKDMDRIVLTYRYFLEMPVDEMAGALGCTESTVRSRISRALARLREQMSEQTEESRRG